MSSNGNGNTNGTNSAWLKTIFTALISLLAGLGGGSAVAWKNGSNVTPDELLRSQQRMESQMTTVSNLLVLIERNTRK